MLTHWVRDRTRGPRLQLETVIHKMTGNNAALYGLDDRGTIAVGKKADLNVIDLERLRLHSPEFVRDLPGGAGRLVQGASGYRGHDRERRDHPARRSRHRRPSRQARAVGLMTDLGERDRRVERTRERGAHAG